MDSTINTKPERCDTCPAILAKYRCLDCKQKYCQRCYEFHNKITATTNHRVSSGISVDEGFLSGIHSPNENRSNSDRVGTPGRANTTSRFFPSSSDVPNADIVGTFQDLSLQTKDEIKQVLEKSDTVLTDLNTVIQEDQRKCEDAENEMKEYVHTIEETMITIRKLIFQLDEAWNSKVKSIKTDTVTKIQEIKENIKMLEGNNRCIQQRTNNLSYMLRLGSASQIQIANDELDREIEGVLKTRNDLRRVSTRVDMNGKGQDSCGTLKSLSSQLDTLSRLDSCMINIHEMTAPANFPTFTAVTQTTIKPTATTSTMGSETALKEVYTQSKEALTKMQTKTSSECTFNVRLPSDTESCGITGIAVLPEGRIIMADFINFKLKLLNPHENILTEHKLDREPRDIAVIDDNTVVVTIPMGKLIQFVHVQTTMSLGKVLQMPNKCCGIAYHEGKIFVAVQIPNEIRIVNTDGDVLNTIQNEKLIQRPTYLALNEDKTIIYVSDLQVKCVYGFTMDGKHVFTYEVQHPHAVSVDGVGNLFVADVETNSIHKVNKKGVKTEELRSPGLSYPQKVSYNNRTNRLAVTMWQSDIIKLISFQ